MIGRLDEAGIHGRLTGERIVAVASVDVPRDNHINNTIDALLAASFPGSIVGPLLAATCQTRTWDLPGSRPTHPQSCLRAC